MGSLAFLGMMLWIAEITMDERISVTTTAMPIPRAARTSALEAITNPAAITGGEYTDEITHINFVTHYCSTPLIEFNAANASAVAFLTAVEERVTPAMRRSSPSVSSVLPVYLSSQAMNASSLLLIYPSTL